MASLTQVTDRVVFPTYSGNLEKIFLRVASQLSLLDPVVCKQRSISSSFSSCSSPADTD